nr:MFS transporter [Sphingomonas sp. Y57]
MDREDQDICAKATARGNLADILGVRPGIFLTCLFVWTLSNMDQSLFGYAIPGILQEFDVPLTTIGTILTVSFLFSAVLITFSGVAADRFGRGGVLVLLLVSSAVAVGAQGLVGGILMLTIMRALGFGFSGGLSPITNALVVENSHPRFRGVAMGILQCGYPLGWLIASLLAAPLIESHGWRWVCFIAFLVVPLVIPIYFILKHYGMLTAAPPDSAILAKSSEKGSSMSLLFSPKFRRSTWASIAMFFLFGGAYAGSAFFFPTYFTQAKGYTQADAAWTVGLSNGIAVFGYLMAALVGEFFMTRRNVFVVWSLAGAAALLGLLWLSDSRTSDVLWYGGMAALFFGSQAVVAVFVAELYPTSIRATALAVCASAPLSLGFAVFPLVVPYVIDAVGWTMGFSVVIATLLVASAIAAMMIPNRASGLEIAE